MSNPVARRGYSEQEITDALTALALFNGSARAAARELKRQGRPIPKSTLQRWKELHADQYLGIREAVRERVWAKVSDVWRLAAERGGEATIQAIEKGRNAMEADDAKGASQWASTARKYGDSRRHQLR